MNYVIRSESQLKRKDGTRFTHVSYFKGTPLGLFHEFCQDAKEAKQFRTKALAELNLKNRFGRGRTDLSCVKV